MSCVWLTGEGDGSGRGGGTLLSKLKLGEPVDTMALHEFTEKDREHVLELLLSQQRVVQLLYNKTFPFKPSSPLRKSRSSSPPKATNEDRCKKTGHGQQVFRCMVLPPFSHHSDQSSAQREIQPPRHSHARSSAVPCT